MIAAMQAMNKIYPGAVVLDHREGHIDEEDDNAAVLFGIFHEKPFRPKLPKSFILALGRTPF